MNEIEKVLKELFNQVNELEKLLAPFEREIDSCCRKRLGDMSISEKIRVAKLLIALSPNQESKEP